MGKYFGTDGFRGRAGEDLTADHAYLIGRVLGGVGKRYLIGRDTRLSGEMLEEALAGGLAASGAEVDCVGVITTPGVAYLTGQGGYDGAVMLSASHNRFDDNGIKLFDAHGEKPSDAQLNDVEAKLDACLAGRYPPHACGRQIGRINRRGDLCDVYIDHLVKRGECPLAGVRVGIDCAHGASVGVARQVLETLGMTVYVTGDAPNGENINSGVGSTHIGHLQAFARAHRVDMGFAFDGDADRCIAVDERGDVVGGDEILYLSARDMVTRGCPCRGVVGTVLSNTGLERAMAAWEIPFIRTPVGDRYVWEAMKREGYSLGGEPSGHIIYARDAVTGDGILTALKVVAALARHGGVLSEAVRDFCRYPHIERNIRCRHPHRLEASPVMQAAVAEATQALVGRGRVLARASGTEPLFRIMCEAESDALACLWAERLVMCASGIAETT